MLAELDWGKREVCVRINKVGTGYSKEDLDFVKGEKKSAASSCRRPRKFREAFKRELERF
jgi:citrate lyase beta subunit